MNNADKTYNNKHKAKTQSSVVNMDIKHFTRGYGEISIK